MARFIFTSRLEEHFREDLESLLYFNPRQRHVRESIESAVERYGRPEISLRGTSLCMTVGDLPDSQCLFALDSALEGGGLAGLIIFIRPDEENLVVLHVAVKDSYSVDGEHAAEQLALQLALQLLAKVREIARRIRGLRQIILLYRGGLTIPVHSTQDVQSSALDLRELDEL